MTGLPSLAPWEAREGNCAPFSKSDIFRASLVLG